MGRDRPALWQYRPSHRFNPRAPRGARHPTASGQDHRAKVSIHAPRVGRDRSFHCAGLKRICFNPRAPRGARLFRQSHTSRFLEFQSTRPAWGATVPRPPSAEQFTVSIHAPRVGRDKIGQAGGFEDARFQSTRPAWGATPVIGGVEFVHFVSIHAPRVGRDRRKARVRRMAVVSIHAPRVGRDTWSGAGISRIFCFNPRAPRGARRRIVFVALYAKRVSIHAPRVGRDSQRHL